MGTVTLAARTLLALVFATAGVTKLPHPSATRATFEEFGARGVAARISAALLAPAELAIAVALMFVPTARWAAIAAALLLAVFIAGINNALRQGRTPDCGCFGGFQPAPIGRSTLVRNGSLLLVSLFVVVTAPGPAVDRWTSARSPAELIVSAIVLAAALAAVIYRFPALQTGAEEPVTLGEPPRLAIGQRAPSFKLRDARAQRRSLRSICTPGLPLVLVFGSTTCGSCTSLFPHLARWRRTLTGRLEIAVVIAGDTEAARSTSTDHDLAEVLADPTGAVSRAYGIRASPAAFILSPDGRIANGPAFGQDQIEDLIRLTLHRDQPIPTKWIPTTRAA